MMFEGLPPAAIYLLGALLVSLLRGRARQVVALAVPVAAFINFFLITEGVHWTLPFLDFELILGRADRWSLIFLNIFTILSFIGILYVIKDNRAIDLAAGLLYAGSAMGVIMAGDLITLFLFWEMLTLGAVLCILARGTPESGKAAYRYLMVHVFGGVVLLAGLFIHLANGGSVAFDQIELAGLGAWLIFLGFGINCAWPVLGAWLTDTYPEASFGGVVFMATYTTKTAVYVLARCFPGESTLIWIGLAMATIPLFYAAIANDLRRILAYCLINQVGFMVISVGLGTELSLNGTAAHAYCHLLYKALLFMAIGSVIYRTGKSKATELGGLYRSMPWTCLFCCIGAISISFPFFCGFVSKSIIMSSAASAGQSAVWLALLFASAGVFLQAGLRVPFFAFFSHDAGIRCEEAPRNQLLAMGITAILCVVIGTFPQAFLYKMLPNPEATYQPYTVAHVTDQYALLFFSALAFVLLIRSGLHPAEIRSTNLDTDWVYRRGGRVIYAFFDILLNGLNRVAKAAFVDTFIKRLSRFLQHGPARLLVMIQYPFWSLSGLEGEALKDKRADFYEQTRLGAFPIGLTAFLAVLLLAILFIF